MWVGARLCAIPSSKQPPMFVPSECQKKLAMPCVRVEF